MSCDRNTFVPKHPDPDKVLAGTDLSVFPNQGRASVGGEIPGVENSELNVWIDGDGTPITEDPYPYMILL